MKYSTLLNIVNALKKEQPDAFVKMSVAVEVSSNIDTSSYDEEGFEELCSRVYNAYMQSDKADLSLMCYYIQDLIDNGFYDSPTKECVERALDNAEHYY